MLLHGRGGSAEHAVSVRQVLGLDVVAALAPQAAISRGIHTHSSRRSSRTSRTWIPRCDGSMRSSRISSPAASKAIESRLWDSPRAHASRVSMRPGIRGNMALMVLTGGLIGPPGTPRNYAGSLDGTPVFIGTSDPDPHVPFERVQETADVLARMGTKVDLRRYPGMPHAVNEEELQACRALLDGIVTRGGDASQVNAMEFDLRKLDSHNRYKLLVSVVVPRPIALVTTVDDHGRVNAAPFSFFNAMGSEPALVVLGIRRPLRRHPQGHRAQHPHDPGIRGEPGG